MAGRLNHDKNSNEALSFIEAFHVLLNDLALFPTALIGLHFQVLDVSPLHTHFAIVLLFFMATIIHHIAYMEIKLQPQDAGYLPILMFICLVSGIIAIELLFAIIISPLWLFMKAFEQKQATMFLALDKLFVLHNSFLLESLLIKAASMYSISIFILYMLTSTKPTYSVRPQFYIGLCATFLIEFAILRF
ncbi:hypothetical protein CMV_020820 [Castanea mollissima]|uniref:Uncharacterized protein n=1 Tax=Castanea mollissima TaxID=60419 RepID=A0A8J4QMF7_9ROSI|nr:hypothetical protein CMV_020820 [Castanea mollissima]